MAGAHARLRKGYIPRLILAGLSLMTALLSPVEAEEIYRFKRMWPLLLQPWYFRNPSAVATGPAGLVYVIDKDNHCIQKYTLDGQFLMKWGSDGYGDGQFVIPEGITVDRDGNVYVTDGAREDVQKFTGDGQFIKAWNDDGGFDWPLGIAADGSGNILVTDSFGCNIRKFTSNGRLLKKWGEPGTADGQLHDPRGIAVDPAGRIYVADSGNDRIQKFAPGGRFIRKWGRDGIGKGEFIAPCGIAADGRGNVYVADSLAHRMQKFSPTGRFIREWGTMGGKDGQFELPRGVAVDASNNVYVADSYNHRLEKFTPNGRFIADWGSYGSEEGRFRAPSGMALDSNRNVYVVDRENCRVQKFTPLGQYITQWGSYGTDDGRFIQPEFIASDTADNVYVTDGRQCKIQKFGPSGQFLGSMGEGRFTTMKGIAVDDKGQMYVTDDYDESVKKLGADGQLLARWGVPPGAAGGIWSPNGIAVDSNGTVYVADRWNKCIQRFTPDGGSLAPWGGWGTDQGEFTFLDGVAVDASRNVFVADSNSHRVQKFTCDGTFISQIGQFGTIPGQMNGPRGVALDADGIVYVADTDNNRIQTFEPVSQPRNIKAIVLAGGGQADTLWDATQMVSNLAYRSLRYQGLTKDRMRYLSSNPAQDLDDNGAFDDLLPAVKDNLRTSITGWAKDAEKLVVYLADHGGSRTFRINADEGEEGVLGAAELASWLDELTTTQVVVIIDACYSGSFIGPLARGGRVVITSARAKEKALFGFKGSLSFSNAFWTQIFNGASFQRAFATTRQAVQWYGAQASNQQHPLVDADGNGIPNEAADRAALALLKLVNESQSLDKAPVVKSGAASPNPIPSGSSTTTFTAGIAASGEGIQRVWAAIWPPDFSSSGSNPVTELPYVDLMPVSGQNDLYEGSFGGFFSKGRYHALLYAMDRQGNISLPGLVKVDAVSPLTHKALLVAGGKVSDPWFNGIAYDLALAYKTLVAQSYSPRDIRVLSPAVLDDSIPISAAATRENVRKALLDWAAVEGHDLVLYLVGAGEPGAFHLGEGEKLLAEELSAWLGALTPPLPGNIFLVYDGCHSGSFLDPLKGPKRVAIASARAGQSASLANDGVASFSHYFWTQILMGVNVRDAFKEAEQTIYIIGKGQVARMDDDGDGKDTSRDGQAAKLCRLGMGFSLGGDPPIIGSICPSQTISAGSSATVWVDDVSTTGNIERVWGMVVPPDYQPGRSTSPGNGFPSFELARMSPGRYEGICRSFSSPGQYLVAVFAADDQGNVSRPRVARVTR